MTQEDEAAAVSNVAWDYFVRTIRNVDGLKRYQGLKAAMRMVTNQVSVYFWHHAMHTFARHCMQVTTGSMARHCLGGGIAITGAFDSTTEVS